MPDVPVVFLLVCPCDLTWQCLLRWVREENGDHLGP